MRALGSSSRRSISASWSSETFMPSGPKNLMPPPPLVPGLLVAGAFLPRGAKNLEAFAGVGFGGAGDTPRHVEAVTAHQHGRARRGQHTAQQRVPSARRDSGGERGLEHLARFA